MSTGARRVLLANPILSLVACCVLTDAGTSTNTALRRNFNYHDSFDRNVAKDLPAATDEEELGLNLSDWNQADTINDTVDARYLKKKDKTKDKQKKGKVGPFHRVTC
jgi:hypothetical protein